MPFGSTTTYTDKIDFAGVIFNHLRLISEGGQHLFDIKSDDSGGQATISSRLRSYYFQIQALEKFLWSSLSKEYFDTTIPQKKKIVDSYQRKNEDYIDGVMSILGNLMIEINNHGWLLKEIDSGDKEVMELRRKMYDEQDA